jgi:CRP-like cAMP-binding protein
MSASIVELQQQVTDQPENWAARLALADALVAGGRADMAAMVVSLAPAAPVESEHFIQAGRHLLPINPQIALQYASQAMQLDEMNAQAALIASEACRALGDGDEAEKHYLVAMELDSSLEAGAQDLKEWIDGNTTSFASKATVPINVRPLRQQIPPPPDAEVAVAVLEEDDDDSASPVLSALPEPSGLPAPSSVTSIPSPDLDAPILYAASGVVDEIIDVRPKRRNLFGPRIAATAAAILEGLSKSKLAVELNDEERRVLARAMSLRDLKQGEVLIQEGSADDHLYVVVSGVLGVVKDAGGDAEVTLNAIRPGNVVGELSFLDGATRYASLVALSDTQVLGLSRADLEGLLETQPRVVYHVMRAIVRVVHEIQRRLSMQTAELTNYLYKTHGRY